MATNSKSRSVAPKASTAKTLAVAEQEGKSPERQIAELVLCPIVGNTSTTMDFSKSSWGALDLAESVNVIREKVSKVQAGDLSDLEATLTAQAATLDAIFNEMARRAALNMGTHLNATETYMRMALKAQGQCRATLETLAEVKYPKAATFIRQQNVAYQQQVNNGDAATRNNATNTRSPAYGKSTNQSNELLGVEHGERLDSRTTSAASGDYSPVEAMAEINGRKDNGG